MSTSVKTQRFCLALDLQDDPVLIEEYKRYHQPANAWPQITKNMRKSGIIDMEIYHVADRLFMIMETTEDFDPNSIALNSKEQEAEDDWQALMWKFQKPLKIAREGEKWVNMTKIYDLKDAIDA
jgi:L-rhamnose mutarotase